MLEEAKAALEAPAGEPTPALAALAVLEHRLKGADRRAARTLLARPTDGASDPQNDGYTVGEAEESPACSPDFCVHWVETTPDAPSPVDNPPNAGDGVPDVVEEALASAEASLSVLNGSLGWTEPLSDGILGERKGGMPGRTDLYLVDTDGAYFGYASIDPGQGAAVSRHSYLVLDEDMDEFPGVAPLDALKVTTAHEYNHVLQFTYDSQKIPRNLWMLESVATWAEEKVYPTIDDYLRFVPDYAAGVDEPLTRKDGSNRIYGAALWNQFLDASIGPEVVRDAWDELDDVTPPHLGVAGYDAALGGDGASPFDSLGPSYSGFAIASAEWRAHPAIFPDAAELPGAARSDRLRPGARALRLPVRHLSHVLLRVPRAAGGETLTMKVRCPVPIRCAGALVARQGTATAGTVVEQSEERSAGGVIHLTLPGGDWDRVTGVVANTDGGVDQDGRYTADGRVFRAKLTAG